MELRVTDLLKTGENLPLMQRREITTAGGFKKFWLVGVSPANDSGVSSGAANPTSFGITGKVGVGLMPLDGAGIIHAGNYANEGAIGMADNNLAIAPNATHVSEWAIIPTNEPNYFSFVNAARRLRNVNFQFDGPGAFLRIHPSLTGKWSDEQLVSFVRNKSLKYIMTGISWPSYKGYVAHGTTFQMLDFTEWKKESARRRKLLPDVKQVVYFHSFINAEEGAPEKYKDARILLSDNSPTDYGDAHETLTKYMFPITPLELREGALIGKARIITNRSGFYGWGDHSKHEIHVFDDKGREVTDVKAPTSARTITKDGQTLSELRLGEGWSAAIVRGQ